MRKSITVSEAFIPLYTNTDPFVLVESPRGCLKTCSILHVLMARAAKWPGLRWYIWRSTRALLSTTVLPSFEEYVIPWWADVQGMRLLNPNARPTQRSEYIFSNGSVFLPIGMDDVLRGTSAEGAGGYLAEAIELDRLEQATALVGMMRQPGVPFHQIIVDANPGPPGHWANQIAEDVPAGIRRVESRADYERLQEHNRKPAADPIHRWKRIIAKIMDNPHYFDADAWQMKPEGEGYLRGLGTMSGHLYKRWVLGDWVSASGSVFPEFSEERNICQPFPWPADWPVYVGYDSGYDHPTAVVFYGISPTGRVFIVDEIHESGQSLDQVAGPIKDRQPKYNIVRMYADPRSVWSRTAMASGVTIADYMLKRHNLHFMRWPAASGKDKENQVEAVRNLIRSEKLPLTVFKTCPKTIAEFQSWSFKRTASGDLPAGDDQYEDRNNDSMDAIMGVCASNPRYSGYTTGETIQVLDDTAPQPSRYEMIRGMV